jgi:hypothetical protein
MTLDINTAEKKKKKKKVNGQLLIRVHWAQVSWRSTCFTN